ncbi:MAG: VOC family protein [Melioribacter sp.]|nr:VOC family protein [Melioribacter sp.]
MKKFFLLLIIMFVNLLNVYAKVIADSNSNYTKVVFEHIGINVKDSRSAALWYVKNLNMKILRESESPNYSAFVADSALHMMIEFNYNKDFPTVSELNLNYDSFHLAFSVPNIQQIKEKLVSEGASILSDIRKTDSGDYVLVLKDPWGLPIQFVQRTKPMIKTNGIFIEHIAVNVNDSREKSNWYVKNLNMKVIRKGDAPSFGTFIASEDEKVMFEFYQHSNSPVIDFNKIAHGSFHVAFSVNNIELIKEKLINNNAVIVNDIYKTPSNDSIMNMRDINGLPLQFVKRVNPMIK